MYRDVSKVKEGILEGFCYDAMGGGREYVKLDGDDHIEIRNNAGAETCIATEDIPSLIEALQAAFNYQTKGENAH